METLQLEKIAQATEIMGELDIDLWLIIEKESGIMTDPVADFLLGTGATWLSFFFFFRDGKKYAIIGNLDIEKFRRLELFDDIIAYKNSCKEPLLKMLQKYNPAKIALNYSTDSPAADGLSYGRYLQLVNLLEGTDFGSRFVSAEDIISKMKGAGSSVP